MDSSNTTLIIGGGINGLSTAFYLARAQGYGSSIFVVDISPDLVSSASGKANGVLADYNVSKPVADLTHLSWRLHEKLADEYNGSAAWGFTKTLRHYLSVGTDDSRDAQPQYRLPEWLHGREQYLDTIKGNPHNCARIDPRRFADFLRQQCEALGVDIMLRSEVIKVEIDEDNVKSALVTQPNGVRTIECHNIVIAAGSWSGRVIERLFPQSHFVLEFDKSHLAGGNWLIMKSPKPSGDDYCHQIYVENITGTPVEISDYKDGRLYVGGYLGDPEDLPAMPSEVVPQSKWISEKKATAMRFVDFGNVDPEVLEVGRCCRPILAIKRPVIAKIPLHTLKGQQQSGKPTKTRHGGVFVNTGQGTSGINLGPGSGLVMSELIRGLQPSVDLSLLGIP